MKCLVMDPLAVLSKIIWCFILLISYKCIGSLSDMGKIPSPQNQFGGAIQSQFTTKNNTRVIAQKGGLAVLPCVVKLNSPATVSWIRRKDFQLLTVGLSTHSSDKRFLVEHTRHMGHWSLRIKSVREEDRGLYECQLSIYPTQSIFIELKVVEAVADIPGAPDLHIDEGSTLRLECKLKRATENPAFVFWYHDSKMVNYDAQDGFSVVSTTDGGQTTPTSSAYTIGKRRSVRSREYESSSSMAISNLNSNLNNKNNNINNSINNINSNKNISINSNSSSDHSYTYRNHTVSKSLFSPLIAQQQQSSYLLTPSKSILTIQEVHFHHAGNYTCAPSNARPASIIVHVLRGEKPAAMQHANRSIFGGESSNSSISSSAGSPSSATRYSANGSILRFLMVLKHLVLFQSYQKHTQWSKRGYLLFFIVLELMVTWHVKGIR